MSFDCSYGRMVKSLLLHPCCIGFNPTIQHAGQTCYELRINQYCMSDLDRRKNVWMFVMYNGMCMYVCVLLCMRMCLGICV